MDRHFPKPANYTIILYCFFLGVDPRHDPTSISWLPGIFWGFWLLKWSPLGGDVKAFMNAQMPLGGGKKHHRYVPGS